MILVVPRVVTEHWLSNTRKLHSIISKKPNVILSGTNDGARERERERERGGERDVRASFWNWPIKINVQIQSEMLIFLIWISIEFCNSAAASRLPSRWLSIINFPWFIFISFEKVLVSKVAKNPLRISFDHISSPVIVRIISAHLHSRLDYFNLLIDSSVFLFAWLTH